MTDQERFNKLRMLVFNTKDNCIKINTDDYLFLLEKANHSIQYHPIAEKLGFINLQSLKNLESTTGEIIPLDNFLLDCKCGLFTDDTGIIEEIIVNGFVAAEQILRPSFFLEVENELLILQKQVGIIEIVWYAK